MTWIHTIAVFTQPDREDLTNVNILIYNVNSNVNYYSAVEGYRKEGEIDWGFSDTLLQATMSGWKLKSHEETRKP